jgi:hypothetical protein
MLCGHSVCCAAQPAPHADVTLHSAMRLANMPQMGWPPRQPSGGGWQWLGTVAGENTGDLPSPSLGRLSARARPSVRDPLKQTTAVTSNSPRTSSRCHAASYSSICSDRAVALCCCVLCVIVSAHHTADDARRTTDRGETCSRALLAHFLT